MEHKRKKKWYLKQIAKATKEFEQKAIEGILFKAELTVLKDKYDSIIAQNSSERGNKEKGILEQLKK